jgi:nicotinamide mononucleotide transporter
MFVNTVTIVMWAVNFAQGGENISTMLMWSIYLINAIIMYVRWNKEAKGLCDTK